MLNKNPLGVKAEVPAALKVMLIFNKVPEPVSAVPLAHATESLPFVRSALYEICPT